MPFFRRSRRNLTPTSITGRLLDLKTRHRHSNATGWETEIMACIMIWPAFHPVGITRAPSESARHYVCTNPTFNDCTFWVIILTQNLARDHFITMYKSRTACTMNKIDMTLLLRMHIFAFRVREGGNENWAGRNGHGIDKIANGCGHKGRTLKNDIGHTWLHVPVHVWCLHTHSIYCWHFTEHLQV